MKKLLLSLAIVAAVASAGVYATRAYFSDTETSVGNTITTGTIDISVDSQNPWTNIYSANLEDLKPSYVRFMQFPVKNVGTNPLRLWKRVTRLAPDENGVNEPECQAYGGTFTGSDCSGGTPKNDIQTVIEYDVYLGGQVVWDTQDSKGNNISGHVEGGTALISEKDKITLSDVADKYVYIGELAPDEEKMIIQSYHMATDTENWAQSDTLTFDDEFLALQQNDLGPEYTTLMLENKDPKGAWPYLPGDGMYGILTYKTSNATFDWSLIARGLAPTTSYSLIYYADPYPGNHPGAFIASVTTDSTGKVSTSGVVDLGINLPTLPDTNYAQGAKIWLVTSSDYNSAAKSMSGWNPGNYLYEFNKVKYIDTDVTP